MALFVLLISLILSSFTCLLGVGGFQHVFDYDLQITPSNQLDGRYFGFYEVDDTLNLTCSLPNEVESPDVVLNWSMPNKISNRLNRIINNESSKFVGLVISNLTENDTGEYKCTAFGNGKNFMTIERSIEINVKNRRRECRDMMFQCSHGNCIHKRYTCDGLKDCYYGEDELPHFCGGNPCEHKLRCPDGRCIPYAWCCDMDSNSERDQNCTAKVKHRCCIHMEKLTHDLDTDIGFQYEQHKFSDMGFLQTTVYTVIGCAMAFMFIVTTIVIATCRIHMRRSIISRCPGSGNRNLNVTRSSNTPGNEMNYLPFYDLHHVYYNRPGCSNNDIMSVNPLLVTYNINNGVQFVGRPVEPPPYCEVITSPPREGPPPPYASQENLSARHTILLNRGNSKESLDTGVECDLTESDALLSSSDQNQISIISSNTIDHFSRGGPEMLVVDGMDQARSNSTNGLGNTDRESDYVSKDNLYAGNASNQVFNSVNSSHSLDPPKNETVNILTRDVDTDNSPALNV